MSKMKLVHGRWEEIKKRQVMKVCFKISSAFPFPKEQAKEFFKFALNFTKTIGWQRGIKFPKEMVVSMEKGGWSDLRSGHATRNIPIYGVTFSKVYLRVSDRITPHWERYLRYQKRADCPVCWIEDSMEMFVHLTAHELGHAILGYAGDMTGEYQCERHAAACLEAWHEKYRPAVCYI